ncbi:putative lipoprotein [Myxococcus xanthus DK 1622]|uniref:Lipoprotein n=1 Tax=Myxococcus xanthus (strain DK1622) TaxID=246197 RepID=Q1D573_MYXXD|nr:MULTISPECIES: hypothetical protein [Myxococcus]ABF88878.1 putative lipoprotein [Myxococcus xanthus DK 1622]NOJ51554.1 hypothetical protein [Myxococcus xanthus]QPM76642.1 hypothetical protein I5Q59_19915 [Myxococcus xanthus]QQR41521.1 hypothetical protein JKA73_20395 [Myxococcus xanthus]QVW65705.1 hypothetical protein JTM82_25265 [Myxococcus xanthus DZ2]
MMEATTRRYSWRRELWLLMAAGCAASGCLIPQDDTLLDAVPDFMNRPPRIIDSLVAPQQRFISDFGADGCDLTFEVAVEDPDVDDRIVVHWYVDYNPQDPRGPYRQYELASTREPRRSDRGTLLISLASANNPLSTPGPHLVEALVTDAELVDRVVRPRPVQLPDGTTINNPGFVVTYSWVVNTVQGDCR